MKLIAELNGLYPGETLRVIGSGPSLAALTRNEIGAGPVVAINFAIRKVETLALPNSVYSMQKDQMYALCTAPILVHTHESAKLGNFGDILFDCETDFNLPWYAPSIVVCLHIARLMACKQVEYLACDSFFEDFRSYDAQTSPVYDQRAMQYVQHPAMVASEAEKIDMEWSATRILEAVL